MSVIVVFEGSDDLCQIQAAVEAAYHRECKRRRLAGVIATLPDSVADVLRESLTGATVEAIATRLTLSVRTVTRHRSTALKSIGVRTFPEAASVLAGVGVEIPAEDVKARRPDRRAA